MRTIQFIALFLGCIFNSYSWAKLIPWDAQVPSSLKSFNNDPQQLAALTGNRILFMLILNKVFSCQLTATTPKLLHNFIVQLLSFLSMHNTLQKL